MKIRFSHLYFTLGCVFLCNPVISVFDILPDFIGCMLIIKSLSELKFLEYRIELAVKELYFLAGISAVRTALMFFYFDMDSSAVLSAVSLLGAAEAFFFIYFAISFFSGINYLASRNDSDGVLERIDGIRFVTIAFMAVRVACTILPELAAIWELEALSSLDFNSPLTSFAVNKYKNYGYVLCLTISTIMAIYWIKEVASFVNSLRRDKGFFAALTEKCNEFAKRNPLVPLYETLRARSIFYVIGCAFLINLSFDGIAVFPAWGGALIFGFMAWRIKDKRLALGAVGVGALLALCEYLPFIKNTAWLSVLLYGLLIIAAYVLGAEVYKKVATAAEADITAAQNLTRIAFLVFALASAATSLWFSSWLHTVRVLLFVIWFFFEIKLVYAILDDIKARIRL